MGYYVWVDRNPDPDELVYIIDQSETARTLTAYRCAGCAGKLWEKNGGRPFECSDCHLQQGG
jgi:hypothetical protein